MLTPEPVKDIDLVCGYCYKQLCTVRTQPDYEKENDTCVYCGRRLFFIFVNLSDGCGSNS
ncbi:hypothetical protein LCGC14_2491930 [marine sediment metagenome]|uniref:Uncharacterized protein n=1 Tax=marine sediment metagenome TaxID=412755 RepID=A0A0F9DY94_9ZZZZ